MTVDLSLFFGSALTLREEIALKRERRLEQEAAQLTFQPTLPSRRGRDTTEKPVGTRFDRLYDDAIKRKTIVKTGAEDSKNMFKPTLSPKSRSLSRDRKPSEFFDSMHKASGAGRMLKVETPVDPKLFKPTLSPRANSLDRSSTSSAKNLRHLASNQRHLEALEKEKIEEDQRNAAICTFAPKIFSTRSGSRSRSVDSKPISVTDRLLNYGEKKRMRLEEVRRIRAKDDAAAATFKPTINRPKRNSISSEISEGGDVYFRLSNPVEKVISTTVADLDAELTFQPKCRKTSVPAALTTVAAALGSEGVHERLFRVAMEKRKILDDEILLSKAQEEAKYTFIPQIPQRKGSSIHETDSVDTNETPVFDRLHGSKRYMQSIFDQIKVDLEMSECTFQPNITPKGTKSVRRASEGPVHERLDKDALTKKIEISRRVQEKLDAEIAGSTFQPHLMSSPTAVRRRSFMSDISEEPTRGAVLYRRRSTTCSPSSSTDFSSGFSTTVSSPLRGSQCFDKAAVDATVERLLAAGGKHRDDLKAKEQERATEEMKGATFTPAINKNSSRIALKSKKNKKDCPDESSRASALFLSGASPYGSAKRRATYADSRGINASSDRSIRGPEVSPTTMNSTKANEVSIFVEVPLTR